MTYSMKIKVSYMNDTRRWRYPNDNQFKALLKFIKKSFNLSDEDKFDLRYIDNEGDSVTIVNKSDFDEAFKASNVEGQKSFKIFVNKNSSIKDNDINNTDNSNDNSTDNDSSIEDDINCKQIRELLLDFLKTEKITKLLPKLIKLIIENIRKEYMENDNNNVNIEKIIDNELNKNEFKIIKNHEIYNIFNKYVLPCLSIKIQHFIPKLLKFKENIIELWIPQLINIVINGLENYENVIKNEYNNNNYWDPYTNIFFPTWFAFMNINLKENTCKYQDNSKYVNNNKNESIHNNIKCNQCGMLPIIGIRYKCCICSNFDLCNKCQLSNKHNINHPLTKFSVPVSIAPKLPCYGLKEMKLKRYFMMPHHRFGYNNYGCNNNNGYNYNWNRCQYNNNNTNNINNNDINNDEKCKDLKDIKLMAEFISDVTLPDRSSYPINTVLTKTWKMKNNGSTKWGPKIYLAFFKGNECICLDKKKLVSNVNPGDEVNIDIRIKTPNKCGRYCAYFRLQRNNEFFGPRVWVDIFSVNDNKIDDKLSKKLEKQQIKLDAKRKRIELKQEKLEKKILLNKQKLCKLNNNNNFDNDPKDYWCVCGAPLIYTTPFQAYGMNNRVRCDICGKFCGCKSKIFHCPKDKTSKEHPNGYDLCLNCVSDQQQF